MQKWSGNPSDLLSDEQRQRIYDYLGRNPLGMLASKVGVQEGAGRQIPVNNRSIAAMISVR